MFKFTEKQHLAKKFAVALSGILMAVFILCAAVIISPSSGSEALS